MKKIFFYIDSMQIGGANRVMANLVDYFSKKDYEVVLVNDALPPQGVEEYQVSKTIKRIYLNVYSNNVLIKNYLRIKELRKQIRAWKPDIILSFMGPPNIRAILSTIGLPIRKIVSVRNDPNREYGTGFRKMVANRLFSKADGVVFQTEEAASYFSKSIQKKSKIIYNPVNEKFYQRKWSQGGFEIVVLGRLEPQKNPLLAAKAYTAVSENLSQYKLVFYGDGELRSELKDYVREKGFEERIIVHGKTNEADRVLECAALYVLCSDYEGMPNALMEAMAVGVPVIATDCPCGGPRTLIQNEEQGILIPCGNSEALARAMVEVLGDFSKQQRMSVASRKRAQQFIPNVILNEWEAFLTKN